jgi:hypothetical protein
MASGSRFASLSAEDIQKLEADQDATNTKKVVYYIYLQYVFKKIIRQIKTLFHSLRIVK